MVDRGHQGPPTPGFLERALRHDRAIVIGAVLLITVLAGIYTFQGVGMTMSALEMTRMARPLATPMEMGMAPEWTARYAVLVFLMWWIMMIAMMAPSATPAILLFAALKRQGTDLERVPVLAGAFLSGYLLIWAFFSLAATGLQWGLQSLNLIAPAMMTLKHPAFTAGFLIVAGAYQLSPLKEVCLDHCRSPAQFLAEHRKPGVQGALNMGAHHGVFCLGCCWALMLLLFVGGVMNLYWILGVAGLVALEKLSPNSRAVSRFSGLGLIGLGLYLAIT